MVGTASDTLAMSVESVGRGAPSSSSVEPPAEHLGVGPVPAQEVRVALHVGVVGGERDERHLGAGGQGSRPEAGLAPAARSASSPWRVSDRAMNRPVTRDGMMLAASPPSVTTPWTWSPGGSCWRSSPRATWATTMASPALTPCHGAAEACAVRPVKSTSKWETARHVASSRSVGQGWTIIAAWTSSKTPALQHDHLAAAALLGRGAQHPHGQAQLVGQREQRRGRRRPRWRR